jgi:hypothetical protein
MMIVDTHVHLYPGYHTGAILRLCAECLHTLAPDAVPVACLTERGDCDAYRKLLESRVIEGGGVLCVEALEDGRSLVVRFGGGVPPLFVLPGRQIATRERIELHCLGRLVDIPDGLACKETMGRILELDGLAVVPWGVGKWLFRRRRVVDQLLADFPPDRLMIGDSAMRPWFWGEPLPMRRARTKGYRILCGSDPLPHETDGAWIGRYALLLASRFDAAAPAKSCLEGLRTAQVTRMGRRPGPLAFFRRMTG